MLALTPVPLETAGERALLRGARPLGHRRVHPGRGRGLGSALRRRPHAPPALRRGPLRARRRRRRPRGGGRAPVRRRDRLARGRLDHRPGRHARRGAADRRRRVHPARRPHARGHGHRRPAASRRARARPHRPAHRARRASRRAWFPRTATSARATRWPCSTPGRCCSASRGRAGTPAWTTPGSGRRPTSGPLSRRWTAGPRTLRRGAQRRGRSRTRPTCCAGPNC